MYNDITVGSVEVEKIEINPWETAQRLKISRDYTNEAIISLENRLKENIIYKYAYVKLPLKLKEDLCDFGFASLKSKSLSKNLSGCSEVYFLAVTLGLGSERYLSRLNIISQAEHFITDGIASSAVESLCDYINDKLKEGNELKPRFSPGYGDLDISFQKELLGRLNGYKNLGISLNDSFFMTPTKSITAIIGIK